MAIMFHVGQLVSLATVIISLLPAYGADAKGTASCGGRKHEMVYSRRVGRHEPETKAAQKWDQAMPTGNGRVGAL
ncbi:MAG: hypothetical protein ACYS9T_04485, partial [Planctomycetota bacterium]